MSHTAFVPCTPLSIRSTYRQVKPSTLRTPLLAPRHTTSRITRIPIRAVASNDPPVDGGASSVTSGGSVVSKQPSTLWKYYVGVSTLLTNLFPIWTIVAAGSALKAPQLYTWLTTPYFTACLAVLMLSMGITLSLEDFRRVLKRFGAVMLGFIGCYVAMPALAFGLAKAFLLSHELTAGLVLVGAVNGGQASNLCTLIANGDVALSIMMTTVTTLGAIFMTPLLSKLVIGTVVPVNAVGIAFSTIQVVLAPIALGMLMNRYANRLVKAILPFSPVVGVAATCVLVGSSIAQCAPAILSAGWALQIPTMLLHLVGGLVGYGLIGAFGYGEVERRTAAIETSMKSSAFAFLLASLHFGSYLVRVPAAVSVCWMALVGSTLAIFWRYMPVKQKLQTAE